MDQINTENKEVEQSAMRVFLLEQVPEILKSIFKQILGSLQVASIVFSVGAVLVLGAVWMLKVTNLAIPITYMATSFTRL